MYSCGSLAPRMGRGGCSDAKFRKPPEPWEFADGCVFFVFEVAHLRSGCGSGDILLELVELLVLNDTGVPVVSVIKESVLRRRLEPRAAC